MQNSSKLFDYISDEDNGIIKRTFQDLDLKEVFKSIDYTNIRDGEIIHNHALQLVKQNKFPEIRIKKAEKCLTNNEN